MSISPLAWRQRLSHPRRRAGDDPRVADANSANPAGRLARCALIDLPARQEQSGSLAYSFAHVDGDRHVPFGIERVGYLYDMPGGGQVGGIAHRNMHQLVVALAGSFDVTVDDGDQKRVFTLNRAHRGLYLVPLVWSVIDNFSSGALCLLLTSGAAEESSCYRDYEEFAKAARRSLRVTA